ncbi:MAG: hypothetical protein JWN48_951 [Myxococcaceae bacterium]|nr:hypothetical protein [Myxococcaceae bacterium]
MVLASCLVACAEGEARTPPGIALVGPDAASPPASIPAHTDVPVDYEPHLPPLVPPVAPTAQTRTLQIVAHQDDDLGLMSPDLLGNVQRGDPLRTVYLTSGDAGFTCNDYTHARELGVRAAYAQMAGVEDAWDEHEEVVLGKLVRVLSLRRTQASLVFMGLHNGGYGEDHAPDLEQLWAGTLAQVSTRPYDGRSRVDTYTRSELIDVLLQLTVEFGATRINTLDSSRLQPMVWPFDHSDHVHSALFGLAALFRYRAPHTVGMYRAYNSQFELSNVSAEDAASKLDVFQTYIAHDPKICPGGSVNICGADVLCDLSELYVGYENRQYRTAAFENITGLLRGPFGLCAQAVTQAGIDAGVGASGLGGDGGVANDSARVQLGICVTDDGSQRFQIPKDGSVRHLASGLCLDAGGGSRGTPLSLERCTGALNQRFLLTTQSQLRGPDSTCVQADGNTLTLAECTLDPRQLGWSPGVYATIVDSLIAGLTDTEIPDDISYYGSLSYGDVDGDGSDDLCVRRVDGLYCAFGGLSAFFGFARVLDRFGDDTGWLPPAYGSTVQLGDIDGDGAAEVCGRAPDGVYCATFSPLFGLYTDYRKRSRGDDFSDVVGYGASASRYRSLRLTDVDGDGAADLCGRNAQGIECARSLRDGSFAAARQWTSEQFSDALGWAADANGTTLRYGDITGDGRVDVCGRSSAGVVCATNDGAGHFVDPHLWSHTGDFDNKGGWDSQLSYYGSIRLADIDGDGVADLCGRSPIGLLCGISTGAAFSAVTSLASADAYSDSKGWRSDRYGSTIGLLDLNLDGSPDLCGWGPGPAGVGLRCALSDSSLP